jgi:DNA-directed RNA polymerase beta subunit
MIRTEVIPHVGDDPAKKAAYLASSQDATTRTQLGVRPADDRTSYICKRINAPGALPRTPMRQYYGKLVMRFVEPGSSRATSGIVAPGRAATPKLYSNRRTSKNHQSSTIESGMESALMTGNWGSKRRHARCVPGPQCRSTPTVRRFPTFAEYPRISTRTAKLDPTQEAHWHSVGVSAPSGNPEGHKCGIP